MGNNVLKKITCITSDNRRDEFNFDYYDNEGRLVGNVIVDELGRLFWSIWDEEYEKSIIETASYIFGKPVENTTECMIEAQSLDQNRWDKAQEYIEKHGYSVNYLQNPKFNEYFDNGLQRRQTR